MSYPQKGSTRWKFRIVQILEGYNSLFYYIMDVFYGLYVSYTHGDQFPMHVKVRTVFYGTVAR